MTEKYIPYGRFDFVIAQGADLSIPIEWTDENGDPINITGYTARLHVRETVESATKLLELTTENGGIELTTPLSGVFTLKRTAAQTALLDFTSGVYDLELIAPGGVVTRLLVGNVTLSKEVTR